MPASLLVPLVAPTPPTDEVRLSPPAARARRIGATTAVLATAGLALAMFASGSSASGSAAGGALAGVTGTLTTALADDALFPLPVADPDTVTWEDLVAEAAVHGQLLLDGSAVAAPTVVTLTDGAAADTDTDDDGAPDWRDDPSNDHVAPDYRQADWLVTAVCAPATSVPTADDCSLVRWRDVAAVELARLDRREVLALPTWTWLLDTGAPQAQRATTDVTITLATRTADGGAADTGDERVEDEQVAVGAFGVGDDGLTPAQHLSWPPVPGATSYRVARDGLPVATTVATEHLAVLAPNDLGSRPSWTVTPVAADGATLPTLSAPRTTARHALWDDVTDRPLAGAEALHGRITWRHDGDGAPALVVPAGTSLALSVPSTSAPTAVVVDAVADPGRAVAAGRDDVWGVGMVVVVADGARAVSAPTGTTDDRAEAAATGNGPWRWSEGALTAGDGSAAGDASTSRCDDAATGARCPSVERGTAPSSSVDGVTVPAGLVVFVPAGPGEVVIDRVEVHTGPGTPALLLDGRHVGISD